LDCILGFLYCPRRQNLTDVVMAIMQKSLRPGWESSILLAFTWGLIKGSVYVEAPSPLAVSKALHGISTVLKLHGSLQIQLVSHNDCINLLQMATISTSIRFGTWVQIKGRGLYHNDPALILEVDNNLSIVTLVLVPWLSLDCKHKHGRREHPQPGLFNL
jgi:Early transcription elongation factor of RNA pol II, NGN section